MLHLRYIKTLSVTILLAASMSVVFAQEGTEFARERDGLVSQGIDEMDRAFDNAKRIDFSKSPSGEILALGDDVTKTFVALGAVFGTPHERSCVGIVEYDVQKAEPTFGSRAAATLEPRYLGPLMIRFCKPGDESVVGTTLLFGCRIAHLDTLGFVLEGYDSDDVLIAKVVSTRTPSDFLGFKSTRPIAYVKIIGTTGDPDFAIDDVMFAEPKPIEK